MPIVRVSMFEGRSIEKKRELIQGITEVVARVCEVSPEGVHVLIDEMTRDNWGRGGILNSDRPRAAAAGGTVPVTGFASVSTIEVAADGFEAYVVYRRNMVNPTMAKMDGFRASILARDLADPERLLLFNNWGREEDWRAYQATRAHDTFKQMIRGELTRSMDIRRYTVVDLPNGGGLERAPAESRYMTVSTHTVRDGQTEAYLELRRSAVNPGMAALDGFCSTTILNHVDAPQEFLIVNQWTTREAAEAYHHSGLHDGFRDQVRALLTNHSGTREYLTVVL